MLVPLSVLQKIAKFTVFLQFTQDSRSLSCVLLRPEMSCLEPMNFSNLLVIVVHIWQKLISVERKVMLIVKNYWQLFSHIFGETMLVLSTSAILYTVRPEYYRTSMVMRI